MNEVPHDETDGIVERRVSLSEVLPAKLRRSRLSPKASFFHSDFQLLVSEVEVFKGSSSPEGRKYLSCFSSAFRTEAEIKIWRHFLLYPLVFLSLSSEGLSTVLSLSLVSRSLRCRLLLLGLSFLSLSSDVFRCFASSFFLREGKRKIEISIYVCIGMYRGVLVERFVTRGTACG